MIQIVKADYENKQHAQALIEMLEAYSLDPMGGNTLLKSSVKKNLIKQLSLRPFMHSFLCFDHDESMGFANCIESFSTFSCQPVLNIHDFAITKEYRGQSLSQSLIAEIEKFALSLGCCKLTLEVLEGNTIAQKAYLKAGFSGYELEPENGKALFWEKKLTSPTA